MYLEHYSLNAKPFDLSPRPQFIWFGEKHEEALATLNYGVTANLGFLLLTGEVGVGKTALIHRLMNNLDSSTIVAHITDPGLGTFDFFKMLAVEFNFASEFHSKGEFLIELEKFLHKAHAEQKKVLLVVDEAQRLNSKLLDQIRVLSNIELSDQKLINIFFIGQPEFKEMLTSDTNRAIRQRIAINYHIDPLTESETKQYIEHRLKVAGATHEIFKPDALREIYKFAGGYPRAINIICDHALVTGYAFGLKTVDLDVIKECESELTIRSDIDLRKTNFHMSVAKTLPETPERFTDEHPIEVSEPSTPRSIFGGSSILIGLCVIIGVLASFYFFWPDPLDTTPSTIQNQLSESSADQSETGMPETSTDDQSSSIDEKALAQSDVENDAPDKAALDDETAPTDSQPDIAENSVTSGFDQFTDENQADINKSLAALTPPPDIELEKQPDQATLDRIANAYRQPESSEDSATPAPSQSSDEDEAGSTVPGKAENQSAAPSSPVESAESETASQTAAQYQSDTTDRQPATDSDQAVVETDQPTDNNVTVNTAAKDVATQPNALDAKPEPKTDTKTQAIKASAVATTGALGAASISKSSAKTPAPSNQGSSTTATSSDKKPARKTTPPEKEPSQSPTKPSVTAKADPQVQSPAESSDEQMGKNGLENRLLLFLQDYCSTYAARDLDAFTDLFVPDARENGEPFIRLLPKYERNFSLIEAIQYRIELEQFSYNDSNEMVDMNGSFFLRYLPPDKKWRENSGTISMRLQEKGTSFLVRRLDYQRKPTQNE